MGAAGVADAPSGGDAAQRFDGLLRVAARVTGTPLAAISLVDDLRAVVRNGLGIPPLTVLPADSPCAIVRREAAPLIVPDTRLDARFRANAIVTGPPGIRFYLGLPIPGPGPGGAALGSLCCMDTAPRHAAVPAEDLELLADLAAQVGDSIRQEAEAAALVRRHARLERRLQTVLDAIPLPLLTIDPAGGVTSWNPAAEKVFGWSEAEVLGRFGPHVPADQIDSSRAIQRAIVQGEPMVAAEAERMRRDGTRLPVAIATAPLRDEAGRPDGAVLVIEDITARRLAEAEAAARAARMAREARLLAGIATSRHLARGDLDGSAQRIIAAAVERLEGCDAAFWRLDPQGDGLRLVTMAGPDGLALAPSDPRRAACESLPLDPALAAERSVALTGLRAAAALPAWLPARVHRAGYDALLFAPIRVAARIEGLLGILAPRGPRGWSLEDRGFLASLADLAALALEAERRAAAIHGLEEAKARAEAANLTKTRFLARMSHELRTPLNAIIGFAELLRDGSLPAAQRQEFAGHVIAAGRDLLAALTAVLDHARVEAGTLVLARERVDPWLVIGDAMRAAAPAAAARGLTLERSDRPMPPLLGDGERLRQAIGALLSNAVKFAAPQDRVAVGGGYDDGSGYAIWVRDAGPGMTREEIARALEPFRQVDEGLDRPAGGTGLGLPLARAFVEAHGGQLVLDSAPGRGTLAVVTLPAELALPPAVDVPRAASAS
ncbi:PAS domain-containing sensor histidine kinase [Dankookia sp. GCM10030260]|uniref:PAS domain-containing sensor histidine kinase n=1 Tax=Dankookia sp. GCM10030260 TaxID=3273390 RepID=UPI00360F2E49